MAMYLTADELLKHLRHIAKLKGALSRDAVENAIELAEARLNSNLSQLYILPFDTQQLPEETLKILKRLTLYLALKEITTQIDLQNANEGAGIDLSDFESEYNRVLSGEFRLDGAQRRHRVYVGGIE